MSIRSNNKGYIDQQFTPVLVVIINTKFLHIRLFRNQSTDYLTINEEMFKRYTANLSSSCRHRRLSNNLTQKYFTQFLS